jgi:hypothetical protein
VSFEFKLNKKKTKMDTHTGQKRTCWSPKSLRSLKRARQKSLLSSLQQRLTFHEPNLLDEISKSISERSLCSGVYSVIFAGPSFTGKTRTIDTILVHLSLLKILNEDQPNERKVYSANLIYHNGNEYTNGKRFGVKAKRLLFEEIRSKLKPVYEARGDKVECVSPAPTGIYIVFDEMDSGGLQFMKAILGELMDELPAWKSTSQFVCIFLATNTGGEDLSEWCTKNEFDFSQARDVVQGAFKSILPTKVCSRLPKIIPFPPFDQRQISALLRSIVFKYLKRELPEDTRIEISEAVTEASLWNYDPLTGLRPVKLRIEETLSRLMDELDTSVNEVPEYLQLGFGPPGEIGFWSKTNEPIGNRVRVLPVPLDHTERANAFTDEMKFGCQNRILPDLSTLSTKFDLIPTLRNHVKDQMSEFKIVEPIRSSYDPGNTDVTVQDTYGNGRVVCSFSLVGLLCEKFKQVDDEVGELKRTVKVLQTKVQELEAKSTTTPNFVQGVVYNEKRRLVLDYKLNGKRKKKCFGVLRYGREQAFKRIQAFCKENNIKIETT